jgi:hypothetical protein
MYPFMLFMTVASEDGPQVEGADCIMTPFSHVSEKTRFLSRGRMIGLIKHSRTNRTQNGKA